MSALSVNATSHALVWLIVPPPSHHHHLSSAAWGIFWAAHLSGTSSWCIHGCCVSSCIVGLCHALILTQHPSIAHRASGCWTLGCILRCFCVLTPVTSNSSCGQLIISAGYYIGSYYIGSYSYHLAGFPEHFLSSVSIFIFAIFAACLPDIQVRVAVLQMWYSALPLPSWSSFPSFNCLTTEECSSTNS